MSKNDLSGLSVNQLFLSLSGYRISGTPLTIGAGGVKANASSGSGATSCLEPPITLGASQTWEVEGNDRFGALAVSEVTGTSANVTVSLSHAGELAIGACGAVKGDLETGPVSVVGVDPADTGGLAGENGNVRVSGGLNALDGNPVSVTDAALTSDGAQGSAKNVVGALSVNGGSVVVGRDGGVPAGTLAVAGGLTLDSASEVVLSVNGDGATAGEDNAVISVSGPVKLNHAALSLQTPAGPSCRTLRVKNIYTLLTSTESVEGTFAGLPENGTLTASCSGGTPATLRINYTAHAVTATVETAGRSNFTWSGTAAPGEPKWSIPTNWSGSAPSGEVGTLTFPALAGGSCTAQPPTGTCSKSENDLSGLHVDAISIDDGGGYEVTGNGITLGAGGITATTSKTISGPAMPASRLATPITLGAPQAWSIGGAAGGAGLDVASGATGETDALAVHLSNGYGLGLGDTEVGPITVTSAGISEFGLAMRGTSLNGSDGNPVSLGGGANLLVGAQSASTIGPLTMSGGTVLIGQGTSPDSTLSVNGSVMLDATSAIRLDIDRSGATPGADFSQLAASGEVNLAGAKLVLQGPNGGSECPALTVGETDTLVTTNGGLTGTFAGVPNGGVVGVRCAGSEPLVQINYTTHGVTATAVLSPVLTVSVTGAGSGVVTGLEISCNNTGAEPQICVKSFPVGESVSLAATPEEGSTFSGWSGACTSTGTCVVTMNSDEAVTAEFTPTKKVEEEAAAKKKAEEEAAAKKKAEEEAAARKKAEEEATAKKKAEEEAAARKKAQEEAKAPVLGQREAATGVSEILTIRLKGTSSFLALSAGTIIPDESEIDATNGRIVITVATASGGTASAELYGGRFRIHEDQRGQTHFLLTLPLAGCPAIALPRGSAARTNHKKRPRPTSRHLWVSESGGSWGTNGRYVSTSVQGTTWLTLDECTRSVVKVTAGKVRVRDLLRKKTRTLTAGKSYVAAVAPKGHRH